MWDALRAERLARVSARCGFFLPLLLRTALPCASSLCGGGLADAHSAAVFRRVRHIWLPTTLCAHRAHRRSVLIFAYHAVTFFGWVLHASPHRTLCLVIPGVPLAPAIIY